ncbi:MAG: beta-1,6-N-acetylglucosaminyltransferase [Pseudomonadota bacterium]
MSVGFAILVHDPLDRAAQVARHLHQSGGQVALHLDTRFAHRKSWLEESSGCEVISRHACDWGRFTLVSATLDLVDLLLKRDPNLTHVVLLSGTCVPLCRVEHIVASLSATPETDYIDLHSIEDGAWVRDGLTVERFSLFHPFNFRTQRKLFDLSVSIQRRLGVKRRMPDGLVPHFGSQWWALSRATLSGILGDPQRPSIERFFQRSFIPDESFFQTMVARHGAGHVAPSLTFSRFDDQGRPFTFYDDHIDMLTRTGAFFARKIWPGSDALYQHVLGNPQPPASDTALSDYLDQVLAARVKAPPGLRSAGSFPAHGRIQTPEPYLVIAGAGSDLEAQRRTLETYVDGYVHGRVFDPKGAQLAWPDPTIPGGLSTTPALRDAMGPYFLPALFRAAPGRHVVFVEQDDPKEILEPLLSDQNAHVVYGTAWPTETSTLPATNDWPALLNAAPLCWDTAQRESQAHG